MIKEMAERVSDLIKKKKGEIELQRTNVMAKIKKEIK